MKSTSMKSLKLAGLAAALPFIYGCGGSGAGIGSLAGFLFGGGGASGGEIALLGSSSGLGVLGSAGGAGVASLVQPEPASMLLVGGGLMAMSYFKAKNNKHTK